MSQTRDDLLTVLKHVHGFELEVPFGGISGRRRWKFDAALTDGRKLALEYMGIGPGHVWHKEQAKDHEKLNQAQLCGWVVLQCSAASVNDGSCLAAVEQALADHSGHEGSGKGSPAFPAS